jgi:CAAX prenyl protease-like protein
MINFIYLSLMNKAISTINNYKDAIINYYAFSIGSLIITQFILKWLKEHGPKKEARMLTRVCNIAASTYIPLAFVPRVSNLSHPILLGITALNMAIQLPCVRGLCTQKFGECKVPVSFVEKIEQATFWNRWLGSHTKQTEFQRFFTNGVIRSVIEEGVFRYGIQQLVLRQLFKKCLEKNLSSPFIADLAIYQVARIALTSLLFTLAQIPSLKNGEIENTYINWGKIAQQALNGLTYGYIAEKFGMFPAILSHFGYRYFHLRSEKF